MAQRIKAVGSRTEVFHGNAKHTAGGLKKEDLTKNKYGRIVSKKLQKHAKDYRNLGAYQRRKGSKGFFLQRKGMPMSELKTKTKSKSRK